MKLERLSSIPGLVLLLASLPVLADEGVLEINQACATAATGCVAGDGAGFPVSITQPGSYRLTGDLTPPPASPEALFVRSNDVTIDLNGFTIRGDQSCSDTGAVPNVVSCTGTSVSSGVVVESAPTPLRGIVIRNGTIRGVQNGIEGNNAVGTVVEDLHAISNAANGIIIGPEGVVRRASTSLNGSDGIKVGNGGRVESSTASSNALSGIVLGDRGAAADVLSEANTVFGILGGFDTRVESAAVRSNGSQGIQLAGGSLVSRAVVSANLGNGIEVSDSGTVASSISNANGQNGIQCDDGCRITGNAARYNGQNGVEITTGSGVVLENELTNNTGIGLQSATVSVLYDRNVMTGYATVGVVGGTSLGGNLCGPVTTTC